MKDNTKTSGGIIRFLKVIEALGNKLPHPIILFCYGIVLIVVLSAVLSFIGVSIVDPRPEGVPGRGEDGMIYPKSLLSGDGIRYMVSSLISNFVGFAPFGTVLISFLGIGIAEKSGLIEAALKSLVRVTPQRYLTFFLVLAGVLSNTASEVGYLVLVPLGAIIFHGFGRHPLAGLAASFAGVSGGYSANLLLGSVDPLLSGLSQESARFLDPVIEVSTAANWYFMVASVFIVVIIVTIISEKLVEPMLGKYDPVKSGFSGENISLDPLKPEEKRGLKFTGLFSILFAVTLYVSVWPGKGVLLNPETMQLAGSPFFVGIVAFIFIYFALAGIVYGFTAKKFTKGTDIIDAMQYSVVSLSLYIVLAFFMAQFIAYFGFSQLGIIFAVSLADLVKSLGLDGYLFLTALIFITAIANLLMGSASAKWALMAPIFVPLFMLIGFSPDVTQAAYRVGDSATNIISPLNSYIALIIVTGAKYLKNFGLGNLISLMVPFSFALLILWSIFFYLWVAIFGLPVGPGGNFFTL